MEGQSQKASRNTSVQGTIGSSEALQQEVSRLETTPANTPLQVEGSGEQTTVTISLERLRIILLEAQPGVNPAHMLALAGIVPTPPPAVDRPVQVTHGEETASSKDKAGGRMDEAQEQGGWSQTEANPNSTTTADASMEEAKQLLVTTETITKAATWDADMGRVNLNTEECVDKNEASRSTSEVEKIADLTLELEGKENHTGKVEGNAEPTSTEREVVNLTEDGERTKRTNPVDEAAREKAATVHIYRRRPAREEASMRQPTVEQPTEAPERKAERGVEGPARSAVEPPRRRRRILIAEEPEEEEEDVVFTLIDTLPSSGRTDPSAEMVESDREMKERKRKGKAIAAPTKKKPRQASSTLVIQEGRQRTEEEDDEVEEALRRERRERQNDGVRRATEQRPELARVQFEKMKVRLDNDLLGRMVVFDDPQATEECSDRIGKGKEQRSGRRLDQAALEELKALGEFMELITGVGFDWLLVPSSPKMPIELAQEFFTSFHFTFSTDVGAESIRFRLFTREMRMSIREWSVRLSLYTADQEAEWFARDIGTPRRFQSSTNRLPGQRWFRREPRLINRQNLQLTAL